MYTTQPEYQEFLTKKAEQERQRKRGLEKEFYTVTDNNTDPQLDTDEKHEDTDPTECPYESGKPVIKKRPTKITRTTENQIDYNTDTNKNQTEKVINNTKRQVNKHLTTNQNITQRKNNAQTHKIKQTKNSGSITYPPSFLKKVILCLTTITHSKTRIKKKTKNNHKPTKRMNQYQTN